MKGCKFMCYTYFWFATTGKGDHVCEQNNTNFVRGISMSS